MNDLHTEFFIEDGDRVTGRAVVTGAAKYSAEIELPGLVYGVLVGAMIPNGRVTAIQTREAERAPGVLGVIHQGNTIPVPGYDAGGNPVKGPTGGRGLQVFTDDRVYFHGQPIALVVADSHERAVYAASLVKASYAKTPHATDLDKAAKEGKALEGPRYNNYLRGEAGAWKNAPVKLEAEYLVPLEVHNPMELHAITVKWEGEDKVTVWDKTQGVKSTQRSILNAFKLKEENVQVNAQFVGGGFGSALRTWPHEIAALIGAKKFNRPLKLVLTRQQMFTHVGFRPLTKMQFAVGATTDGKLVGIRHEAASHTSMYEEFTEGTVNMSRFMYACPNVETVYKVYPMNLSTPTWMRGPGEATGAIALECALDELAYQLKIDPVQLRVINHADTDPERNKPYTSKFLKEAYALGAEKIGWAKRNPQPRSMQEDGWLVGYGMASGVFNASRGTARALARLMPDGSLLIQSAVADSGPGTATAMTRIAAQAMNLPESKVRFELGDSSYPPGPTQGGSTTTSTLGSAVHDVCLALQTKVAQAANLLKGGFENVGADALLFSDKGIALKAEPARIVSYAELFQTARLPSIEAVQESKGNEQMRNYVALSWSVHYVKVKVHPLTGVVRVADVVTVADSGKIVSEKTAASQMIGGVVGGIGMALTEEGFIDHRYGQWVNNNFADYHVPVHADVPHIQTVFVNKPDPILNPIGAKGMGEIALIGFAAAVANAVYHATGKRIRELPITPDKLIAD
jgi:xanthine dehydrogenase YagR molybdenum-binding subunit